MILLLLVVPVLSNMVSKESLVKVRSGDPAVLQCEADPGDTLLSVTWKLRLYNSSCVISYKIEEENITLSYSSCSPRIRSFNLSLTISNTDVSDEGTYTCEAVYEKGILIRTSLLQVLDVASARRGLTAVLQCEADPGDTLLSVTWKLRLINSSCVISYKIEENTKMPYSSCSPRMRSDHLSLTISNTEVSDGGSYTCEVVNENDTFFRNISLQILDQPTIYLKLNDDGSPECGAIGGNPPAEISWIPHSDDRNTTKLENPDRTWSVISTFRRRGINGTSVTCVVSHPTFVNPWKGDITLNERNWTIIRVVLVIVISFVLFLTCLLLWKVSYLRTRFKAMVHTDPQLTHLHCEEEKQDCEPYVTYTQRENTIYCMASKFVARDEAAPVSAAEHAHSTPP